ncbi:MAG: hypothetical protein GX589_07560 [Deltaproteobacteria bacterium]|nr:hypothetical protein [Deltaproteobacteria bacterium]
MFRTQCFFLAVVTLFGAACVYLHDCDGASLGERENFLLRFGHFRGVMMGDSLAVLFIAGAGIIYGIEAQKKRLSWLVVILLAAASAILLLEFFAELGVLVTEDQMLLSVTGQVSRVLAVLLNAFCFLWAMALGMIVYLTGQRTNED